MSIFSQILSDLAKPDDQGNDWYGWASNQTSHAFFGALCVLFFGGHGVQIALILALLKETVDLVRGGKVTDSLQDISFWVIGAWVFSTSDSFLGLFVFCMALVCGVVPRLRVIIK